VTDRISSMEAGASITAARLRSEAQRQLKQVEADDVRAPAGGAVDGFAHRPQHGTASVRSHAWSRDDIARSGWRLCLSKRLERTRSCHPRGDHAPSRGWARPAVLVAISAARSITETPPSRERPSTPFADSLQLRGSDTPAPACLRRRAPGSPPLAS
jgi:hypothetical protein